MSVYKTIKLDTWYIDQNYDKINYHVFIYSFIDDKTWLVKTYEIDIENNIIVYKSQNSFNPNHALFNLLKEIKDLNLIKRINLIIENQIFI